MNKSKIPNITSDRLDLTVGSNQKGASLEEVKINSFLKKREMLHQFTLRIPVDVYQSLRKDAFNKDTSISVILNKLINQYLEKEKG